MMPLIEETAVFLLLIRYLIEICSTEVSSFFENTFVKYYEEQKRMSTIHWSDIRRISYVCKDVQVFEDSHSINIEAYYNQFNSLEMTIGQKEKVYLHSIWYYPHLTFLG